MLITEQVFKDCKKNDRKAQLILFDAFKSRVMGLCRRYSANTEEAQDIFQETFLKVFNKIKQVDDLRYLHRWMMRTAVNTAINYYHRNKRHHKYLSTEELDVFDERDGDVIDSLSTEQLMDLVNELPVGYRLVFNLYIVEGYKHPEIGEMLNISENTSKSQLSRAKSLMKLKLKELGIEKFEKYG